MNKIYVYMVVCGAIEGEEEPCWENLYKGPFYSRQEAIREAQAAQRAYQGYYAFKVRERR